MRKLSCLVTILSLAGRENFAYLSRTICIRSDIFGGKLLQEWLHPESDSEDEKRMLLPLNCVPHFGTILVVVIVQTGGIPDAAFTPS